MFASAKRYIQEVIRSGQLEAQIKAALPDGTDGASLFRAFRTIRSQVQCPHNPSHVFSFIVEILALPRDIDGCIVEAGCFKGGSTSQFSLCADIIERDLVVFDSFEGLPENEEDHDRSILGHSIQSWFKKGEFCGSLEEVQSNVRRFGVIERCRFIKGWFDETMPDFHEPIAAAYIDVDLASSTRTCLKYLYPLLVPGGILMSQDGDFPLVIDVFKDEKFWNEEVGVAKPEVRGLGNEKMLKIVKPA